MTTSITDRFEIIDTAPEHMVDGDCSHGESTAILWREKLTGDTWIQVFTQAGWDYTMANVTALSKLGTAS